MSARHKQRSPDATPGDGCCPYLKNSGDRCKLSAGFGTDHPGFGACRYHAGTSKTEKKLAQEEAAVVLAAQYGLPAEVDPHIALIEELHRTAGHVAWLGSHVAKLEHVNDLYDLEGGAQGGIAKRVPSVWVRMYQDERAHFTRVAKTCIDVGIAERQVKLAEEQGRLMAQVIKGILKDLGVAEHPEAPEVVRRHLTAISGGRAA